MNDKAIGFFTFVRNDGEKMKMCHCIGANNCSDINCALVKERLDKLVQDEKVNDNEE